VVAAVVILAVAGCGRGAQPGSPPPGATASTGVTTPEPTATVTPSGPTPSASTATTALEWRLRYALLDHYPDFAYCDPDYYPVARRDEQSAADDWWSTVDKSSTEVQTILAQRGYREPLHAEQRLAAYQDHKKLSVITMSAVTGGYAFELSISQSGGEPDRTVLGMITNGGTVQEASRQPRIGGCPICLEAGARIATPYGDVPVALIQPGDVVWTTDADGRRVAAAVETTTRRATPGPHLMLRLVLSDGRGLIVAGAHPSSEGDLLRELRPGRRYDGAVVVSAQWTTSTAPATFDILPAGVTGTYWANGILVGSTLRSPVAGQRPPEAWARTGPT
jgi:hypothetical protein